MESPDQALIIPSLTDEEVQQLEERCRADCQKNLSPVEIQVNLNHFRLFIQLF